MVGVLELEHSASFSLDSSDTIPDTQTCLPCMILASVKTVHHDVRLRHKSQNWMFPSLGRASVTNLCIMFCP